MTTAADLVSEAQQHLLSGIREPRDQLAAGIDGVTTTMSFTFMVDSIQAGSAVYVDLEGMYVWSVDSAGQTAVVSRGSFGTTAVAHSSSATVYVNPRFPKFSVLRAVNEDLNDLSSPSSGLCQMRTVEVPYSVSKVGYDLTGVANVEGIYDVEARYSWLSGNWQPVTRWHVDRNANLTDFPSGYALHVSGGGQPGQNLRVVYRDRFTQLTNLTDDVQAVSGLPATANDIPALGAAMRLMAPREAKRSFTESQGDTRRADETPSGAALTGMRGLDALRTRRIAAESARLQQQYPYRKQGR